MRPKPITRTWTRPTPEEEAKIEAQISYRQQADARRDERERQRRTELERRTKAIQRALKAYRKIDDDDVTDIRIRTRFIRTDDARRQAPVVGGLLPHIRGRISASHDAARREETSFAPANDDDALRGANGTRAGRTGR